MNYIGSKYSLLPFLQESISDFTGYKNGQNYIFADLFAGTGVVGATFKDFGCTVIANDIQYYSFVLNKHYINGFPPMGTAVFDELNCIDGVEGFIYKNYCAGSGSGRNYFNDENGKKCDAMRIKIEDLYRDKLINEQEYFYCLASLINSIDKYANTASVYGAFLKHTKKSAAKKFFIEPLPIIDGHNGQVFNKDINALVREIHGDVLYLDPPYNTRQYCANYHVLETIARYDKPTLKGMTGLRDYSMQKSAFCSKRTVEEVFDDLLANANFKYICLSYNNEGLMSFDTIERIMSKYGLYKKYEKSYRRFKADKTGNRNFSADVTTEYLHCLRR